MKQRDLNTWLRALRSGKYQQNIDGYLCITDDSGGNAKWCCLGVGVEVLYDGTWYLAGKSSRLDGGTRLYYGITSDADGMLLPASVCGAIGLHPSWNSVLAYWNDEPLTFDVIADRLEAVGAQRLGEPIAQSSDWLSDIEDAYQ